MAFLIAPLLNGIILGVEELAATVAWEAAIPVVSEVADEAADLGVEEAGIDAIKTLGKAVVQTATKKGVKRVGKAVKKKVIGEKNTQTQDKMENGQKA
ncbi:hypothetical protein PoB_003073700 [Plakobranchus ocellatus]|uniref:Uncharacterized protein n=1 Tax=Plakobranchus ocellatus TaxID=259542 RepID=A0AAV4AB56_9GAST|nr:hypothetical protein PoB_003073700 [Plakobranchus ocellatus]